MRNNKKKVFLYCAVVAAIGLLAAPGAMTTGSSTYASNDDGPSRCIPFPPSTIQVTRGPCIVTQTDLGFPVCKGQTGACQGSCGPDYTGIQYTITTPVDSVATLVTANNTVSQATGNLPEPTPCKGDTTTGLGKNSCHEQAVKILYANRQQFWVVVAGNKQPIMTTVAAKKYSTTYCTSPQGIVGLGLDIPEGCVSSCGNFNPDQTLKRSEVVDFKGCAVQFDTSVTTGAVLNTTHLLPTCSITQPPPCSTNPNCSALMVKDVKDIEIRLQTNLGFVSLGTGNFGDGTFSTGSNSCTTRVIGGRVYSWGSPCP